MTQQFDLFGTPVQPALPKRKKTDRGPEGPTVRVEPVTAARPAPAMEAIADQFNSTPGDAPVPSAPADPPAKPAAIGFAWETATQEDREFEVLCWFVAKCDRGATAEEASAAFGRDLGVLVAQLAAQGKLEETGKVLLRSDRRTFARALRASRSL